jgi:hypothetical protein
MVRTALALAASLAAAQAPPPDAPRPDVPPAGTRPGDGAGAQRGPIEPPVTRDETASPGKPPLPRGAVLEEVSGTVREVDRKAHRLGIDTGSGRVTLALDRNTMVYTSAGLATVLDVRPGVRIRAGRNADFLAYWVQVLGAAPTEPPSTPGQGTGPAGGGSAPAGESSGPGTGPVSPPTAAPSGTSPGGVSPGGPPGG